jgi:hypothetical protein
VKALIAIFTCSRPKYQERLQTLRDTWIPLAAPYHDIRFFDGARLGVPDDYWSLPQKTKALCKYAIQHGYDYLLKVDDDTYVHPDKLAIPSADYAGIRIKANDLGFPPNFANKPKGTYPFDYASGGAYWLSRRAMEVVAEAEIDDWAEDRWVGQNLAKHGIFFTELPDYLFYHEHSIEPYLLRDFTLLTQIPSSAHLREYHRKFYLKTPKMFDVSREEFDALNVRLVAIEERIAKYNRGAPHKI